MHTCVNVCVNVCVCIERGGETGDLDSGANTSTPYSFLGVI